MALGTKRLIFYLVWLLFVLSGPITILQNVTSDLFQNPLFVLSFFQRLTGLLAFTLIFVQIMLGAHMQRLTEILGSKIYYIHVTQGLFAYGLMLTHPLMETAIVYLVSQNVTEALYVFWPAIASSRDINLLYGKIALVMGTLAFIAGYFRTHTFFRRNWKAFHLLNYLVFYLIVFHTLNFATDISFFPFNLTYWVMVFGVSFTIVYKVFRAYFKTSPYARV